MDYIDIVRCAIAHESNTCELLQLNGSWMIHDKYNNTYTPLDNDRRYSRIKSCVELRTKKYGETGFFSCQCGYCQSILLGKLYGSLYKKKTDDAILEEAIKEVEAPPQKPQQLLPQTPHQQPQKPQQLLPQTPHQQPQQLLPQPQPIKQNNSDHNQILFGKYKGRTFQDVFNSDKKYCLWCIETRAVEKVSEEAQGRTNNSNMQIFVQYCKDRFSS
jgi:hypothetical protein